MPVRTTAAAVAVFAAAWLGLMSLKLTTNATDVPLYQKYGTAVVDGRVPYRDFHVEYPPAALAAFALPAAASSGDRGYRIWFELLMGLCGAGTLVATGAIAARFGGAVLPAVVFAGAAILALGPVSLGHFDLWPALLLSTALAALAYGRRDASAVLLGVAVAAKVYPVVAAPFAVAWLWRAAGGRTAVRWTAVAVAAAAACFLPFFALAPHGVVSSITGQADRPLQLESSAGAALLALHQLAGLALGVEFSHASVNLGGRSGDTAATLTTAAELAVLLALLAGYARARRGDRELAFAVLASVLAFVTLGKVFSPQFLLWLIPLAPLAGGTLAVAAAALVGSAVILTRLYFPSRWHDLIVFEALPTWLLVARDLVLLALLALLVARVVRRPTATSPSPPRSLPGTGRSRRPRTHAPPRAE